MCEETDRGPDWSEKDEVCEAKRNTSCRESTAEATKGGLDREHITAKKTDVTVEYENIDSCFF